MLRYIGLLIVASVVLMTGFLAPQEPAPSQPPPDGPAAPPRTAFQPDRILVKLKDQVPLDTLAAVNRRNDASLEEKIPNSRVSVVDIPDDLSVAQAVERYENSPDVEYAEPDYEVHPVMSALIPSDPGFQNMYPLYNRGQRGGIFDADIDAPEAWIDTTGNPGTVVAVIDTGMDISHPDLRDNIWTNPDEIEGNGKDDDRNGYVDDVHGWDFRNEDNSVFDSAEEDSHATHIAGTIAAEGDNGTGVTGISWQTMIMPLKFAGDGPSYISDAVEAINYSVAEGAQISNNSWGGGPYSQTLRDAIANADAKGQLFVAAAGNNGKNNDTTPFYPASYGTPSVTNTAPVTNIISVAASNNKDTLTSFSNYGATSVDLAAPGIDIYSTLPNGTYGYGRGTSMAAPHVSGAAALVASQSHPVRDDEIKARILQTVDTKASLAGNVATGGRLNAAKALGANTAPIILGMRPGGRIRDLTPAISATVRDDETELTEAQIELYLDGRPIRSFSYDQARNKLTYRSRKLATRRHRVAIVAYDEQQLSESRAWTFKVIRRR